MTIEKLNGGYRITDIFQSRLIVMDYYYYNKKESIKLFNQHLKDMLKREIKC